MKDARQIQLRPIGDVYLPRRFTFGLTGGAIANNTPLKLFGPKELSQLNRIFGHLLKGGIAVTSGQWDDILRIFSYLEKKKSELIAPFVAEAKRRGTSHHHRTKRWHERRLKYILSHVMVIAYDDRFPYVEPPIHIPYLLELLGEPPGSNSGLPFLVPVTAIQKIRSDMEQSYYVPALEGDIIAHSNVLPPVSQDTMELFLEGLRKVEQSAAPSAKIKILDMGCGCGCLSLLAAKVFSSYNARIVATDILPEAIATTKLNVQRFIEKIRLTPNLNEPAACSTVIETTGSGDLFEPVGDQRFDLIIFNAPWVVSRPRSRAEIAICDANQNTVRRFLMESPKYLNEGGYVVLGYSDHSGPRALKNLEDVIGETGLKIENIFKRRIKSRRQKRKWETILVYNLRESSPLFT